MGQRKHHPQLDFRGRIKNDSKMTQDQSSGEDLAKLRSHLRRAYDAAHQMAASLRAQVDPLDVPPNIAMLVQEISKARLLANQLSDRLHGGALSLLLHGHQSSREAY